MMSTIHLSKFYDVIVSQIWNVITLVYIYNYNDMATGCGCIPLGILNFLD